MNTPSAPIDTLDTTAAAPPVAEPTAAARSDTSMQPAGATKSWRIEETISLPAEKADQARFFAVIAQSFATVLAIPGAVATAVVANGLIHIVVAPRAAGDPAPMPAHAGATDGEVTT